MERSVETKHVKIENLVFDFSLYPRDEVSNQAVTQLMEAYTLGNPVPPMVLESKTYRVVDGFHRGYAQKKLGVEQVEAVIRSYKNEGELFADAVRLNAAHGRAFDNDDRKRAVIKLSDYGYEVDDVSAIVNVTTQKINEWVKGWGTDPAGHPVPVKCGLQHMAGRKMTKAQVANNDSWSGMQPTFHINQLIRLIKSGSAPKSEQFRASMDELVSLWMKVSEKMSN